MANMVGSNLKDFNKPTLSDGKHGWVKSQRFQQTNFIRWQTWLGQISKISTNQLYQMANMVWSNLKDVNKPTLSDGKHGLVKSQRCQQTNFIRWQTWFGQISKMSTNQLYQMANMVWSNLKDV